MELRELESFVAVARCLHFGRAAEDRFITQSAISQQIIRLERSVGVPLFERHSRRVKLTPAGTAFLPNAQRVLETTRQAADAARAATADDKQDDHMSIVVESTWTPPPPEPLHNPWVRRVSVTRLDSYPIVVAHDRKADCHRLLTHGAARRGKFWLVTDTTVWRLHKDFMEDHDRLAGVLEIEPGETAKDERTWSRVLEWLAANNAARRDSLVAFGGSVISDLVGFVAATYMRGIAYVNVPTTLLAQVDGAMGGKVAVNTSSAKNLVGAFWHPQLVFSDTSLLSTLDRAEVASGLAETVKTFAIEPHESWQFLEDNIEACLHRDMPALTQAVRYSADIKMHLVEPDPYERDLRRVLNFGHTLGHPIETSRAYRGMRHGEAVAIGMASAARLGLRRGITTATCFDQLVGMLQRAELPTSISPDDVPEVVKHTHIVAAIRGGSLRFVIPERLGRFHIVDDLSDDELYAALVES